MSVQIIFPSSFPQQVSHEQKYFWLKYLALSHNVLNAGAIIDQSELNLDQMPIITSQERQIVAFSTAAGCRFGTKGSQFSYLQMVI